MIRTAEGSRRGLTKSEAAEYAGCTSVSMFNDWVRKGILPHAIPGTRRWDRKAIDLALDKASNLTGVTGRPMTALERWQADKERKQREGES
jgi:hypothetical protein